MTRHSERSEESAFGSGLAALYGSLIGHNSAA